MSKHSLPKAYDFKDTESRVYAMWESGDFFKPHNDPNKPDFNPEIETFVISIPPPNVTGELHLGHAMFVSMEDLMIRYHRMKGYSTLWVPGSDHAGIATQLQVEKMLRSEGTSREEIGREKFLQRTWEWKEKYGGLIQNQIRRLGASCDWDRERFTLDEGLSRAVREAFVSLYEKKLIYRGPRLINWSPGLKTAVSDLEVEYGEEETTLYYFKYVLKDSGDHIPVATIRPETILGDTAVAVHPEDERYQKFIGKTAIVPILGREIPVIADDYVSREFGTGALKITPGHDPNDYDIAQRHELQIISILDQEAKINEHGGKYEGQDRFECREKMWEDMRAEGLVIKEEPYTTTIPRSQRGGEIIEPMISTQWFVKIAPLAEKAITAVKQGDIQVVPQHFEKVYFNWLENIKDWCISRQLWWGHRIPVWYCQRCNKLSVTREDPTECVHCGSNDIEQDPDVLDTWFSSGLWPFSTLGWPDETPDYEYFYPTSYMETGYDILFFWVARMIMDGLEFTGKVPFHTVYLHGLIRDETGRKMSKSFGNVIDPLEVMNKFGTDALRFTLLVGSTPGNDMNLAVSKVEANRNFANKVWNAGRFTISAIGQIEGKPGAPADWTLADSWIWAKLQELIRNVERLFQTFHYGEAGRQIYDFFWSDFADWYVEIAKEQLSEGGARAYTTAKTLSRVLDMSLRLLHPFTPFVTEELWGHLRQALMASPLEDLAEGWSEVLMVASWPGLREKEGWEENTVADFVHIQEVVRAVRNVRAEKRVKPSKRIPAMVVSRDKFNFLNRYSGVISTLSGTNAEVYETIDGIPEEAVSLVIGPTNVYLPLAGMVDLKQERSRLEKELAETESHIKRLEKLLASDFSKKAPDHVVSKEIEKLAAYKETAQKIQSQINE